MHGCFCFRLDLRSVISYGKYAFNIVCGEVVFLFNILNARIHSTFYDKYAANASYGRHGFQKMIQNV